MIQDGKLMGFAMGHAIPVRTDYAAGEVRRFAQRAKDAAQARRLLAIAAVLDGASREEAAKIGGMDRQTLRDWVIRFNEQGADGLINISSPGMPPKLNATHRAFLARIVEETPVEVWFQDEMRVGQKNKLTYRWARKGARPRAAHDQRTQSTYLFGAVCPERGAGAALVLPACNTEAMQLHLDEIATKITPGAHAILLLDQAGWHGAKALKVPSNISLLQLPPRAPELNGQENIWQFMRQNWLSNRIFKSFDDIVDHCCYAWNTLVDQPWKIMSIARRDWAAAGHSI
jgi:putative transposase